jgi:beta-xylosidase
MDRVRQIDSAPSWSTVTASTRIRVTTLVVAVLVVAAGCVAPGFPPVPPPVAPGGAVAPSAVVTDAYGTEAFDFPDPSVIRVGDTYYGYATGSASFGFSIVPVVRSTDLVHWTYVGEALPGGEAGSPPGENRWADLFAYTWAPSVTRVGANFLMYYAARERRSGLHCIGVAVSTTGPAGPFHDDAAAPLVCQRLMGGSIDPDAFVDRDARRFLLFKSEGTPTTPTRLWSAPLASDGRSLASTPKRLMTTAYAWEQPIIEGPTMVHGARGYTLFYSASRWATNAYAIGAAHCEGPLGPCSRTYSTPVVGNRGTMVGAGGPTIVSGGDGHLKLGFHAWTAKRVGYPHGQRSLRFLPITWANGRPVVG